MRFLPILTFLLTLSFAVFAAEGASAQTKVTARTGAQKGYTRLVVEWPSNTPYTLSKEGNRVLVRFAKAGTLDLSGVTEGDKNVRGVKVTSGATEPLQIAVTIPDGSRFRDFIVADKFMLDVYDSEKPEAAKPEIPAVTEKKETPVKESVKAAPVPAVEAVPEKKAAEPPKKETPPPETPKEEPKAVVTTKELPPAAPLPEVVAEKPQPQKPSFAPHVITLTSLTSVGLSAYERGGWLWMVTDDASGDVAPEISGPQKETFPKLQRFDVPGGAGYRLKIPAGMKAYAEGGGLGWRIVLGAKGNEDKGVEGEAGADANLIWPMRNMRKALTFTDPFVGDKVTTVTSSDAKQYAGAIQSYVNLDTLPGIVGLTFAAKTDGLTTKVNMAGVIVGAPSGLTLSDARDSRAQKIRQEVETPKAEPEKPKAEEQKPEEKKEPAADHGAPPAKDGEQGHDAHADPAAPPAEEPDMTAEEIAQAAGEKPAGNNIYNFPRWEMGGVAALNENQHSMMLEIAQKTGDDRIGDLITMAKMLLANNRGAEALGILRMVVQQAPALVDNKEFQSLRAAALATSGKYDEAIEDFSRESLNNYDDIKYWRAYTLSGLEDWQQAGAIMPSDMAPIMAYPKSIRTPMLLAFAEIALRNGKAAQAQGILKLMETDLPTMRLPYAASWNYLAGEAQRQGGNPKAAENFWTPLVKNGKDDLFRAKAGLSLTKLQLDQKQIKPEEALDRLEGLRYAWRGDELETLINYRLGQVYVENKDYIKGLTVLRQAFPLSPGTKLNKDLRDYTVNTFKDIFVNNRITAMSPIDGISLYEEFKTLIPPGSEGDGYVEKLAERLVDADLLGRAASLLEGLVNNRLQGDKKAGVAIRLLDGNPDGALRSLDVAQATLDAIAAGGTTTPPPATTGTAPAATQTPAPQKEKLDPEKQRQIHLLRARALSLKKQPDQALVILDKMPEDADVNRLRADIAWSSGKWTEAAIALNDLIVTEDISARRPLTDYQRDLLFNRSIALNLAGDRVALANLRERYNSQMKETSKGQMFEIVTRPRRPGMIGSREAIESMMSEIDMFKGFLDGYSKMNEPPPANTEAEKAAPTATPLEGAQTPPPAEGQEQGAAQTQAPAENAPAAATTAQ